MNNNQNEFKGLMACALIPRIRKAFQVFFYVSLVVAVFIFIKLTKIDADFVYYAIIVFAYVCSYAVLLVLRAIEHLIGRVFYLEQELGSKGVIDRQPPQQNN